MLGVMHHLYSKRHCATDEFVVVENDGGDAHPALQLYGQADQIGDKNSISGHLKAFFLFLMPYV